MVLPSTAEIGVMQDRIASPSRCTVQAPHWAMPQPNLVPVRPSVSRSTQSSGVSGATSTDWAFPFTVNLITGAALWREVGRFGMEGQNEDDRAFPSSGWVVR